LSLRQIKKLGLLILVFLAGLLIGLYLTVIRYEYLKAYTGANGAFFVLASLENGNTNQIRKFEQADLIATFAHIERLPRWAKRFNPSNPKEPISDDHMRRWHDVILAAKDNPAMKAYGMTTNNMEQILHDHFSYWETWTPPQSLIDEVKRRVESKKAEPVGGTLPDARLPQ
jgi:hypothetical protein